MTPNKLLRIWPAAVALIVVGCSSSPSKHATGSTTTSTSSTSVASVPPATTGASTSITAPTAAGGPLPGGFTVTDLTWVSTSQGWALGTAPCAKKPCTSVAHTLDGGQTWAGLPAPKAYLQNDPAIPASAPCAATVACVQGIRFANAATGYAFGVSSMWLTTNGGHTWSLRSTDATDALEVANGLAVRISHPEVGCPPGCPYKVQTAATGSTSWQTLPAPPLVGYGAALAVEGANVYVAVFGHVAGGAENAHAMLARSSDHGQHWVTFTDPCGMTPSGREADTSAISAAPGGNLAVACTPRATGEAGFVTLSVDSGASFGAHRGNLLSAVPPDGEQVPRISAPTGSRLAVLVTSSSSVNLAVSNDAGVDWTTTHTEATGSAIANTQYLGFQDATTGRAVLSPRTILTTTDGGGHWTPFTFP